MSSPSDEKGTADEYTRPVVEVPHKVINYSSLTIGAVLLTLGLTVGAGSFWAGMKLLNKSFTDCYARGGVVRLPLAASGGAEGKNSPVWGYFTTVFGKQHYLLSLGLSKEGPEFDSYYREPLVIMGKKEFEKIVKKAIASNLKAKKK